MPPIWDLSVGNAWPTIEEGREAVSDTCIAKGKSYCTLVALIDPLLLYFVTPICCPYYCLLSDYYRAAYAKVATSLAGLVIKEQKFGLPIRLESTNEKSGAGLGSRHQ